MQEVIQNEGAKPTVPWREEHEGKFALSRVQSLRFWFYIECADCKVDRTMDGPDLPFSLPAHPTEIDARLSLSFSSTSPPVSQ